MLPDQPSRTLLSTAIRRATHQLLDTPRIFDDPVALQIVPEAANAELVANMSRDGTPDARLLRALFAMRSRFAEERLADAFVRAVRQYVMLGAGLDTFPWRQPAFAKSMHLFAADHPASLAFVKERLRVSGLSQPDNLTWVPIDLEHPELMERLACASFDTGIPSFFSVLGVTQYLSPEAVNALLTNLSALPAGSEVVVSFALPDEALSGPDLEAAQLSKTFTGNANEPWLTRMDPCDLTTRLRRLGYRKVFHLTPEVAQDRYFNGRSDGLHAPRWEQLLAAVI
jgi:methyltransferase (TIGR00027 family)